MKEKGMTIKIWILVLAVWLMGSVPSASVYAQDYDSSREGSVTINLDDLGTEFSNVVFTCYKVADVDTGVNLRWVLATELEHLSLDLNALKTAGEYQDTANLLKTEVGKTSISGQQAKTDASGQAVFTALEQGVYLLVQTDTASYGTVEPFLVAIPYTENGSEWVYDVQTETKGEPLPEEKKEEGEQPRTGDDQDIMRQTLITVCAGGIVILSATVWYKRRKKDYRSY